MHKSQALRIIVKNRSKLCYVSFVASVFWCMCFIVSVLLSYILRCLPVRIAKKLLNKLFYLFVTNYSFFR